MAKQKKRKKKVSDAKRDGWMKNLLRSDSFRAVMGILLLVMALFVFLSEVSYFFTGAVDQSFIQGEKVDEGATNWTGGIGAYCANWLINGLFGVTSIVLPFIIAILALLLMNVKVKSLRKCLIYPVLLLVWLPILLQMIIEPLGIEETFLSFGGKYGRMMHALLHANLGWVGECLLMIGAFAIFGCIAFGWNKILSGMELKMPNLKLNHNKNKEVADDEDEEDEEDMADEITDEDVAETEEDEEEAQGHEVIFENVEQEEESGDEQEDMFVVNNPEDEPADSADIEIVEDDDELIVETTDVEQLPPYDPTLDLSNYKFPSPELLKDYSNQTAGVSAEEQQANQQKIIQTLRNFNIGVKKIVETIGPTVTLFEIIPEDGVRVSKISNLEKDIMLSLSATGIRLIAPMPGKGTIGIEVPNANPKTVGMRALIQSPKFKESNYDLPVVMGRTITNGVFMFDLASTPHLIVAGATGQGKSVGLNAIITSLLYTKHPSQVKFVLVDPKQLEFSMYRDIERHYLAKLEEMDTAVITDSKKVIETLESVCQEMEDRYYLLSIAKVRNIKEYNAKFIERKLNPNYGHRYLPYIVVILDEFGDLIATEGKKIETPIQRITQKARAAGIHMILATQRPSVNVITGVIKANCPTRIAFRVISKTDSMTILDCTGADQLIGRGDMLYSKGNTPERVQCAFVDTPEVERIVEHIHSQQAYDEAYTLPVPKAQEGEGGERMFSLQNCDEKFNEVAEYVVMTQLGSTSNLQRKFEIGFNRAGKLMDQLECAGVVGPAKGSKPREILIKSLSELEALLASYR